MKAALWTALILGIATVSFPAAASPVPDRCTRPEPRLEEYSSEGIVVTLTVDYSGCRWWQGHEIKLAGDMERSTAGTLSTDLASAAAACLSDGVRFPDGRTRTWKVTSCSIGLAMPHEELELATYSGEFEYPWRKGFETVTFSYTCSSMPLRTTCEY